MTLARLEAQKEQSDLMRSWSKEDVSSNQFVNFFFKLLKAKFFQEEVSNQPGPSSSFSASSSLKNRESPKRGGLVGRQQQKSKPMSPDEWLRKLEAESHQEDDEETIGNGSERLQNGGATGQSKRGKKKKKGGEESIQLGI